MADALLERRRPRPGDGRVYYRPDTRPLPPEPGRELVIAAVQDVRRRRGRITRGDDRLETDAYAVKRYLHRLGHAQRTGRYACSVDQLVAGLAPIMGWGAVPARGTGERERWFRRHRESVRRWLSWLADAELVDVDPELDNEGYWWRTLITLRASPAMAEEQLHAARARMRGWPARAAERAARIAPPKRSLQAIRARSGRPHARTRAHTARQRAFAVHEQRRRRDVEATIAAAQARREANPCLKDLGHPYGAPTTSVVEQLSEERFGLSAACLSSALTLEPPPALVGGGSACAREPSSSSQTTTTARLSTSKTMGGAAGAPGSPDLGEQLRARVAAREAQRAPVVELMASQAEQRAAELLSWPAGRSVPFGRLREAWVVYRCGAEVLVDGGARGPAGPARPGLERRAARALALYELYAAERPPGWPQAGAAALTVLAAYGRDRAGARTLAGDVGVLQVLAKDMRAQALYNDPVRLARAAARAQKRAAPAASSRFSVRVPRAPLMETADQRRARLRDAALLAGEHPALSSTAYARQRDELEDPDRQAELTARRELAAGPARRALRGADTWLSLDGFTDRAERYQRELAAGAWDLPPGWPNLPASVT